MSIFDKLEKGQEVHHRNNYAATGVVLGIEGDKYCIGWLTSEKKIFHRGSYKRLMLMDESEL